MKKLLVISPHFPPVNAADMQRVRMVLPFFRENGWKVEVLVVSPDQVASPLDPWLVDGLPPDVPVHSVQALSLRWTKIPGLGTLGFRALWALARSGDRLLRGGGFDLVYFSTTVFEVHLLGPRWKRKFGVPFAMDYQDPWVNDYYREHPHIVPPGGRLKYKVVDTLHRWMEPRVLKRCAGFTCVSPEYPRQLKKRYPKLRNVPHLVQSFPGSARDFERLGVGETLGANEESSKKSINWVYVGRGGADMSSAVRAIFRSIRDHAPNELRSRLRLSFVGTSYAAAGFGKKTIEPIAAEFGLQDIVDECPNRISYRAALARIKQADALIVPGSDDPSYTASKLFPYLLAGKPLLTVFHKNSSVVDLVAKVGGAVSVTFDNPFDEAATARDIGRSWIESDQCMSQVPLNQTAFYPYTDRGSASDLARFLKGCV